MSDFQAQTFLINIDCIHLLNQETGFVWNDLLDSRPHAFMVLHKKHIFDMPASLSLGKRKESGKSKTAKTKQTSEFITHAAKMAPNPIRWSYSTVYITGNDTCLYTLSKAN